MATSWGSVDSKTWKRDWEGLNEATTKKSWRRPALRRQKATLFSLTMTYWVLPWLGKSFLLKE